MTIFKFASLIKNMSDSISDFLNKLKTAQRNGKESFLFPASKFIISLANFLEKKGYIASSVRKGKKGRFVEIKLAYVGADAKVKGIKRVSRLSKRVYLKAREIHKIRSGFGASILSTPKGILSDMEARAAKVGGEVLFEIW